MVSVDIPNYMINTNLNTIEISCATVTTPWNAYSWKYLQPVYIYNGGLCM